MSKLCANVMGKGKREGGKGKKGIGGIMDG